MIPFYDIVGFVGVFLIMLAYLLLQTRRLRSDGLAYSVLNLLGASGILYSLGYKFNMSAFVMEVAWVAISLIGIINYLLRKSNGEAEK